MSENIAFCIVLFLALYGILCLLRRLTLLVLRPAQRLSSFSVAYLREGTQDAEQIIRYFRAKADREDVLLLIDNGADEVEKQIVERLCENRRDVRFIRAENFVEENCNYEEDII